MIVWSLGKKIIITVHVLCCTAYDSYAQLHTREQFLNLDVGFGLHFIFVCLLSTHANRQGMDISVTVCL